MKVIFLDVDGVLHPLCGGAMFLPSHMDRLKRIVDSDPTIRIVLSSSWRTSDISMKMVQVEIEKLFAAGIKEPMIGKTPNSHGSRSTEILYWLYQHNKDLNEDDPSYVTGWVVLDDINMVFGEYQLIMQRHAVHTESQKGLTEEDTAKAIEILRLKSAELPSIHRI